MLLAVTKYCSCTVVYHQCLHPLCRRSWSVWCSTSSTWQRCSGRPSSLLDVQASVSPECVSSTDLSASPLRPHQHNHKVLNGLAPRYLGPLTRVANLPGRRALRSASSNRLHIPPVRLSTVGTRAFSVAGPRIWNNLPEHITSAGSLHTFCHRLKTHLFQRSYS